MEDYRNGVVSYICDKCGKGKMISYSAVLCVGSSRVLYPSKCDGLKCGFDHNMLREYPQKIQDVVFETELENEVSKS